MKNWLLLLIGTSLLFAEGARGSKPHSIYVQASYTPVSTDQYFSEESEPTDGPKYTKHGVNVYSKYGTWLEELSLVGNFGFRTQKIEAFGSNTALEDISLKLDYQIVKGTTPFALSYEIGLPTGDFEEGDPLSTGDGEVDHKFRLYASWEGWDFVTNYHLRTKGYTDSYGLGFQYKHNPYSPLWLTYGFRTQILFGQENLTKAQAYLDFGEGVQYAGPYVGAFYTLGNDIHAVLNLGGAIPGLPQTHLYAAPYIGIGLAWTH